MNIPMYRDEKKEYQLEKIQNRIVDNGGMFRTKDAEEMNIDYRRLQTFVKEGRLRKIKSGYYTNDKCVSEEQLIVSLFPDGVLTMETALYYYGMLSKRPEIWRIAIDKNTSKGRFHLEYPWVMPYYTEPDVLETGVSEIMICGKMMKIYSKERLMCDVLKYRDKMETKDFRKAVFSYIEDEDKDIDKLLEYSEIRKVRNKVHNMIGIWLD
jgi:hypothetical protein